MMERGRMSRAGGRVSELPKRVQDGNRTSLYTTPQSKPSFGKLSVQKSVTSERRTSYFGARSSGVGVMSGFAGAEKVKDVRPLHDKTYVQQCIRQLQEFLSEQSFPGPLSSKMLQSPSTKEFVKMFEFIYCQIDPMFEMPPQKVEEEVPALLKALRYPFVLSKSSMYSVGAPHTWPQALGALMWLIDTVKATQTLSGQDLLFSEFSEDEGSIEDGAHFNRLFIDYTADTYGKFIQGQDLFEEEDAAFIHNMQKLYAVDEAFLASEEEKHRFLSAEVERLEKESHMDQLMPRRMEKMKLQSDLKKLQTYSSNLDSFIPNLEAQEQELKEEQETGVSHVQSLQQEQMQLQEQLLNQKFTPADVERLNKEKEEVQQTLSSLSLALEEAEQHQWNEEMALARSKEKMDLRLAEYHKLARKLKLIPTSAENACGHDFEIRGTDCNSVHLKSEIQRPLRNMISNVEEENSRITNFQLSQEEALEQLASNLSDKVNDLKQLKEQIRKLDERLDTHKQEAQREEQVWGAEMESIEQHRSLLEKKVNYGYEEALQQLKAAQQQYHLVLQETNEERRTVSINLTSVLSSATTHLSVTEKSLEDFHSRMQRLFDKAVEEDEEVLSLLQESLRRFRERAQQ